METLAVQETSSASLTTALPGDSRSALRQVSAPITTDTAVTTTRTLTVRNFSSRPQSFVLLASPPAFVPLAVPSVTRHCVYQASLLVAAETGSHTFVIPVPGGQPDSDGITTASGPIYAVTGCARQKPESGVRLFVSDVHALQEGDGVGPGERCGMTMPEGYEAAFSKAKMAKDPDDDDPIANTKGIVGIETDNSFDSTHQGHPFLGLGAPNPYNVREIVPILTWDAVPGNTYLLRPNLHTWILARSTGEKGSIFEPTEGTGSVAVTFSTVESAVEAIFEKDGTFTLIRGVS